MALRAAAPVPARTPGPMARATIIAGYVVVFWGALPALVVWLGFALDDALDLDTEPSLLGLAPLVPAMGLLAWAAVELRRRGRGLPIGALPPQRLVASGPYRFMRHPMYLGWNVAVFGLGLLIGSPALAFIVAPLLLPAWIAYARVEEAGLARRFGAPYRRYRRRVGLLPGVSLYTVSRLLVLAGALPVSVQGAAYIPKAGPAILVPNHTCYLDPAFVGRATRRTVWFTTTAEAFRSGPLAFILRRLPAVPLRRYRPDPVACREVLRLLSEGELVCIFPEGERTPHGGRQAPIASAVAMIARLKAPVLPVGIIGGADVGPRWSQSLRRRPVTVRIGPPLSLPAYAEGAADEITGAWDTLMPQGDEAVHLAGLNLAKLASILWRCAACGDEKRFSPASLSCAACGARWAPTTDGYLDGPEGSPTSLACLARTVFAFPEAPPLWMRASGFEERCMFGPIHPLRPLGEGELRLDPERLTFGGLEVSLADLRYVTTERADTLQVATATGMWQFRPTEGSAFRLKNALDQWRGVAIQRNRS